MAAGEPIVRTLGVGKSFGGVAAVSDASIEFRGGEILALAGENGAGKSTLIKIVSGVQQPDAGTVEVEGRPVRWASPAEAIGAGISVIYQEFSLFPTLDAIENIVLGAFPERGGGVIDWRAARERAREALADVGLAAPPRGPVSGLGVGQQQLIEVARAISRHSRVLIMDEPTAALSERETEALLALMRRLRERGVSIVFVSHRLDELLDVADRFVVMRDGRVVRELSRGEASRTSLIEAMVGRPIGEQFPRHGQEGKPQLALRVEGVSGGILRDIGLEVHRGEVVGLAGLMGSGRSSLLHAIFGSRRADRGTVAVAGGEPFRPATPREAMRAGIGLVPEDRRVQGLVGHMDVAENLALASLRRIARLGIGVARADEVAVARPQVSGLGIRLRGLRQAIFTLSGGNQQKVVIGRWLAREPRVLLLDEPTRGVDVGAKAEIYRLIRDLTAEGLGVLMTSSELPELLGIADRILVLHEGRIVGEVPPTASQAEIMHLATGGAAEAVAS